MKSLLLCAVLMVSSSMSFAGVNNKNVSPFEKAIAQRGYKAESKISDCELQIDKELNAPVAVCTLETIDGNVGIVVFGKLKMNSKGVITKASMISHDAD